MKTLKNNSSLIPNSNKDEYISPDCKVYYLEMEEMICSSPSGNTTGDMEITTSGGSFPGTSFWNSNN